jgi:hypothetical protein
LASQAGGDQPTVAVVVGREEMPVGVELKIGASSLASPAIVRDVATDVVSSTSNCR